MTVIGESSGVREEEVFTDIPVDTEQLVGYAPVVPMQPESEEDEDTRAVTAEPVRGGVLRSGSQDADEDESENDPIWSEESEDPAEIEPEEVAAEEVPEEGSPVFHTFEDDLLGEYADRIIEQGHSIEERDARIAQLEEENQVHQQMENQYKEEAYMLEVEVAGLQAQLHEVEHAAPQLGPMVQQLMLQNTQLRQTLEQSDLRQAELQVVYQATRADMDLERVNRIQVEEAWARAAMRVDVLERQLRDRSVRVDSLEYTVTTIFDRLRDRVRRYPRESGSSRRVIRRRVVDRMARQGLRRAVRRSRR